MATQVRIQEPVQSFAGLRGRLGAPRVGAWWARVNQPWVRMVVVLAFVVAGVVQFRGARGDDLASSYVGCRLVATGHQSVLYSYDTLDFADIGESTEWVQAAKAGDYWNFLHPYVQTPLWAYSLKPLCMPLRFWWFKQVFLAGMLLSLGAAVWLVARFWVPALFHPIALAGVLGALYFAQPFQYAMLLVQTHALFFVMTLGALMLAERRRPGWAGLLLAGAAAVKITPGFLVVYWLLTRRWRAAAWMAGWSAVIFGVTLWIAGPWLVREYLADLQRVSRVLLVAMNNQSLAAWWMGRLYGADEIFDINIYQLPEWLRLASLGLTGVGTVAGGWMDRARTGGGGSVVSPLGALLAMLAATLFAPIAWTHYSIILVAPLMVLGVEAWRRRSGLLWGCVVGAVVLNYPPLAARVATMDAGTFAVVRGQFFAGVLCMVGLGVASWLRRGSLESDFLS